MQGKKKRDIEFKVGRAEQGQGGEQSQGKSSGG